MSLTVEVTGFGLCQTVSPYSILVICVQQEAFQAWTVYRQYSSFISLAEQLHLLHPSLPNVPKFNPDNLSIANLDACRCAMDNWLQTISCDPLILRTQSMYQFLCVDANMPPPYLEIHWRNSINSSSFDEMEMEDIFEKHLDEDEYVEDDEYLLNLDDQDNMGSMGSMGGFEWEMNNINNGINGINNSNNGGNNGVHGMNGGPSVGYDDTDSQINMNVNNAHNGTNNNSNGNNMNGSNNGNNQIHGSGNQSCQLLRNNNSSASSSTKGNVVRKNFLPQKSKSVNSLGALNGNSCDDDDDLDIKTLGVVEAEILFNKNDFTVKNEERKDKLTRAKSMANLESFHIIKVIGKGSFGKVYLVRDKATQTIHALKVLKKDYIIRKNQVEHTKTERSVLGYVHHPFIVGLTMAFQTTDKLFFVLDYCAGGELFFHLGKVGRFQEDRAKFYASQITLALEYVHSLDIIYRDLKPENVLLDHHGNVRLTDFGLSKEGVRDHSTGATSFCGTPEYIAPEVLLRQGHGRAVDWWSLGALLFEMISGLPPFYSRNREIMFEKIMKAELAFPPFMSESAKNILSRLLQRDPRLRLGSGDRDAAELKEHSFFCTMDFEGLAAGRLLPPWVPSVVGSLDTSQFDMEFTSMLPVVSPDVRDPNFGSMEKSFLGFTFVNDAGHLHDMMANAREQLAAP